MDVTGAAGGRAQPAAQMVKTKISVTDFMEGFP
jgi:hypothetical protein